MLFFRRRRRLFGVAESSGVTVLIAVSVGALSLPRICKTTSPSFAAGWLLFRLAIDRWSVVCRLRLRFGWLLFLVANRFYCGVNFLLDIFPVSRIHATRMFNNVWCIVGLAWRKFQCAGRKRGSFLATNNHIDNEITIVHL